MSSNAIIFDPELIQKHKGFVQVDNLVEDFIIPQLKLSEQAVYRRIWRLTRGFNRLKVTVRIKSLALSINITARTVIKALASLEEKGLIKKIQLSLGETLAYEIITPWKECSKEKLIEKKLPCESSSQGGEKNSDHIKDSNLKNNFKTSSCKENSNSFDVDFKPLESIGLTRSRVLQILKKGKLSAKDLNESIEAFAFDLQESSIKKEIRKPLGYFMSLCLRGDKYEYSQAFIKRKTTIELEKTQLKNAMDEEIAKINMIKNDELIRPEFQKWISSLSNDEIMLYGDYNSMFGNLLNPIHMATLKCYFQENVWQKSESFIRSA